MLEKTLTLNTFSISAFFKFKISLSAFAVARFIKLILFKT